MTAADLNPELRTLIDEQLDAIEQVLLCVKVSYSERRSIVGEVETQIFELLSRKSDNPTREDLVAVLESLDPPESYIPEEFRSRLPDDTVETQPARRLLVPLAIGIASPIGSALLCGAALLIVNYTVVVLIVESQGFIPWVITVAAILYLNYRGLRRLWSWYAKRHSRLVENFRSKSVAWLSQRSGARA